LKSRKWLPPNVSANSSLNCVGKESTQKVQTVKAPLEAKKDLGPLPKQAKSAYMYFNMEFFLAERKRNPNCSNSDAFKLAGQKWGTMSDKDKAPYNKQAENDKARYERQLDEREKKGYFLLEDKSKSTDP
jgi:hypothetical protein